jgi:ATP-dependent DNA helicase RecG
LLNEWKQAAVDFTVPPVRHRFRLVPCMNDAGAPDQLALIEVEPSEHVHETVRGDTILRIGDENRRLGPVQAMELRFDKGESIYDGTAVKGAREADLEPDLMDKYVAGIRGVHRPNIVLQSRGLLVGRDGALAPTVAGLLVLGRDPQQTFPEAYVRLIRYRGSSRETGVRANVIQDVVCGGPITAQIDAARRRLRRWIPATIRLGEAGRFARATLIPEFAWLEAIVNAVVHRSYSMAGDHTPRPVAGTGAHREPSFDAIRPEPSDRQGGSRPGLRTGTWRGRESDVRGDAAGWPTGSDLYAGIGFRAGYVSC